MTNHLSKAQKEIVCRPIGKAIQVLASAGTGKTRVLTERVRYILENTKKDGIIALTFTNKAAEEMKTRLENSGGAVDRFWIATIHSVAQRVVDSYAHTIGLPSELHIYDREHDRKAVFLQSLANSGLGAGDFIEDNKAQDYKNNRNKCIQIFMDKFSKIKRNLLTDSEIRQSYGAKVFLAFQNYQEELLRGGGIDFDDILVYAHQILIEQPWCGRIYRAKYKHIHVDEAQDLNKAQYEFIKAFCAGEIKSLFMAGDPDQMIYGFNGSSTDYLCKHFPKDFEPIKHKLKENYRSSKSVIRLADKLKPGAQKETDFALEGKCEVQGMPDEEGEAQWICDKIKKILKQKNYPEIEGPVSLSNISVIARNRFVFQSLENALKENNINYHLKKAKMSLEPVSDFGKILDLSLRLKLNPKDWISEKKLTGILKPAVFDEKGGPSDVYSASRFSEADNSAPLFKLKAEVCEKISSLDVEQPKMLPLFKELKREMEEISKKKLKEREGKELELSMRELESLKQLWLLFRKTQSKDSLAAFRSAIALGELTETNGNMSAEASLMLSAAHTMKGMEKDIVFLMGMCEGLFPDYRAVSEKELEEEKNSAFVAITRAKRRLYITYPKQRKMPWGEEKNQFPSRFIRQCLSGGAMQTKEMGL